MERRINAINIRCKCYIEFLVFELEFLFTLFLILLRLLPETALMFHFQMDTEKVKKGTKRYCGSGKPELQ